MTVKPDIDLSEFDVTTYRGPRCTVSIALERLNDEQRVKFIAAMGDSRYQSTKIAAVINGWLGEKSAVQDRAIRRHRDQSCQCE